MACKVVVVGAVAGGASCAARLRRLNEHARIVLFERGPDPSFANCGMPYHIGKEIEDRSKLSVATPASLKAKLNLDVRVRSEVTSIDTAAKTVAVTDLASARTYVEPYDELVLSLGAKPFLPPIPGIGREGNLALRNLEDMDRIISWISGGADGQGAAKTAVVAGGGFIGIEMAEQLSKLGIETTIVEALPQLLGPFDPEVASMLQQKIEGSGVRVELNAPIKAFEPRASGGRGSDVLLGGAGEGTRIAADVVILGLGVRPDTDIAKAAGVELGARGGIVVDDKMRTSVPHVWAVGDAVEVKNPFTGGNWMVALAGPANRQGRLCADNIAMGNNVEAAGRRNRGTYGTSAVHCFGLTAAGTGLNERGLQAAGIVYGVVHAHPMAHASYYPGAMPLALKLLFRMDGGVVLGAQAVGADGADKAIDIISTAVQAGMTVSDLADLELCYSPQVGSAKAPVNMAGMMAQNVLDGLVETVQWSELPAIAADSAMLLLDVRSAKEVAEAPYPNALNIPIEQLRERMAELPRDGTTIVAACASGQRGYYAVRILKQSGFDKVKNLDGAIKTLSASPMAASLMNIAKAV
eukprot:scaffold13167_cov123-Isochrysis_galbana.AAC.1